MPKIVSPLKRELAGFFLFSVATVLLFLLPLLGGVGIVLFLIFLFPWIYGLIKHAILLLTLCLTAGGMGWRKSKQRMLDGDIVPSWTFAGSFDVLLVDEAAQKLCLAGAIVSFAQIVGIRTWSDRGNGRLDIFTNDPQVSQLSLGIANASDLDECAIRLENSVFPALQDC